MWSLAREHYGLLLIEFLSGWNEAGLNWINLVLFQLSERWQSPQRAKDSEPKACFCIHTACGAASVVKIAHWPPLPICVVCCMCIKTKSRLQTPAGGQFSSIRSWPTFLLQSEHVRHLRANRAGSSTWDGQLLIKFTNWEASNLLKSTYQLLPKYLVNSKLKAPSHLPQNNCLFLELFCFYRRH